MSPPGRNSASTSSWKRSHAARAGSDSVRTGSVSTPVSSGFTGRASSSRNRPANAGRWRHAGSLNGRWPCVVSGAAIRNRAANPLPRASPFVPSMNCRTVSGCAASPIVSRTPSSVKLSDVRRSTRCDAPSHSALSSDRFRMTLSRPMPCPPNTTPASLDMTPPDGQPCASVHASASGVASAWTNLGTRGGCGPLASSLVRSHSAPSLSSPFCSASRMRPLMPARRSSHAAIAPRAPPRPALRARPRRVPTRGSAPGIAHRTSSCARRTRRQPARKDSSALSVDPPAARPPMPDRPATARTAPNTLRVPADIARIRPPRDGLADSCG